MKPKKLCLWDTCPATGELKVQLPLFDGLNSFLTGVFELAGKEWFWYYSQATGLVLTEEDGQPLGLHTRETIIVKQSILGRLADEKLI